VHICVCLYVCLFFLFNGQSALTDDDDDDDDNNNDSRIGSLVYSSVASIQHLDADADSVRSFLRDCIRNEGTCDRASFDDADRPCLDLSRDAVITHCDAVITATALPSSVRAPVARPHRDLVR